MEFWIMGPGIFLWNQSSIPNIIRPTEFLIEKKQNWEREREREREVLVQLSLSIQITLLEFADTKRGPFASDYSDTVVNIVVKHAALLHYLI